MKGYFLRCEPPLPFGMVFFPLSPGERGPSLCISQAHHPQWTGSVSAARKCQGIEFPLNTLQPILQSLLTGPWVRVAFCNGIFVPRVVVDVDVTPLRKPRDSTVRECRKKYKYNYANSVLSPLLYCVFSPLRFILRSVP